MSELEQQYAERAIDQFVKRIEKLAGDLEELGAAVRRESARNYTDRASYIQHTVLWGLANLNLDNLPRYAREADDAIARAGA